MYVYVLVTTCIQPLKINNNNDFVDKERQTWVMLLPKLLPKFLPSQWLISRYDYCLSLESFDWLLQFFYGEKCVSSIQDRWTKMMDCARIWSAEVNALKTRRFRATFI